MSEIEIFWRVDKMEWDIVQGGVVSVYWSVVAKQDGVEGKSSHRTNFSPDPLSPDFIPIKDITEAQVLGWVTKEFADVQIELYEKMAKADLTRAKMPPLVSGLPWEIPS